MSFDILCPLVTWEFGILSHPIFHPSLRIYTIFYLCSLNRRKTWSYHLVNDVVAYLAIEMKTPKEDKSDFLAFLASLYTAWTWNKEYTSFVGIYLYILVILLICFYLYVCIKYRMCLYKPILHFLLFIQC